VPKVTAVENSKDRLYDRALRFLSFRPRSEKEVLDYLSEKIRTKKVSKGQAIAKAKKIILRLKSLGLIDDREFTRWWLEQRQTFRPKGKLALRQELRQKGIDDSLISRLLDSLITPEVELETAKKLARKRLKVIKSLPFLEQKRKLVQFLGSRGFSYPTIKLALDEVFKRG